MNIVGDPKNKPPHFPDNAIPASCPICGAGFLWYSAKTCRISCLSCQREFELINRCPECSESGDPADWEPMTYNPKTKRWDCPRCGFYFGANMNYPKVTK